MLVLIAGAELFTGNALMVIPWLKGQVSSPWLLRNWGLVYLGNLAGALAFAVLVVLSGVIDDAGLAGSVARISEGKLALGARAAFFRGVLCNLLVCLAVWMSFSAHTVAGKVIVILLPIAAFVAIGFEHSVANMYVIPVAMLGSYAPVDLICLAVNLFWVMFGNIFCGTILVAASYWVIFIWGGKPSGGGAAQD